jgi:hypothetical protein
VLAVQNPDSDALNDVADRADLSAALLRRERQLRLPTISGCLFGAPETRSSP